MKAFLAFLKKEISEQIRSGRFLVLGILFLLFGIMNPAIAKLTPWIMESFADTLAQSGMILTEVSVTAMDSWIQFYKNIPMALIAFVMMQGAIFTKEYASGTLILSLSKGLSRYKVVMAKGITLTLLWTLYFWLCYFITYGYNCYYWDNSVAQNLTFSAVCWWVFGLWILNLLIFFSTLFYSSSQVLLGVGGVISVCYLLGLIPKIEKVLPTFLADGYSMIYGHCDKEDCILPLLAAALSALFLFLFSLPIFKKKRL